MAQDVPRYRLADAMLQAGNGGWVVVQTQVMLKQHHQRYAKAHPP